MAAVKEKKRKTGTAYEVAFRINGCRRYISLSSDFTKSDAREIASYVDRIVASISAGRPLENRVQTWLDSVPEELRRKFANAGLITIEQSPTIGEIFDAYWDSELYSMKPSTQSNKSYSRRYFFEFVNESKRFEDFSKRDASDFVNFLDTRLKEASRAGIVRDVSRVFKWAMDMEIIERNPFSGIRQGSYKNKAREYYVSMEDFEKMIDACPSAMWRSCIALYRIGGLRFSEALQVQWRDVDFLRKRLLVHSPKTERHYGRESRVIPLFPRLAELLEEQWELTPENSSPYVIYEHRTSIRLWIGRIVFDAGLNRWERLFQNMRSSCAIDVSRKFGELAESEWIGHSPQTARNHYLHLLDEDFERATRVEKRGEKNGRFESSKTTVKTTSNNDVDS